MIFLSKEMMEFLLETSLPQVNYRRNVGGFQEDFRSFQQGEWVWSEIRKTFQFMKRIKKERFMFADFIRDIFVYRVGYCRRLHKLIFAKQLTGKGGFLPRYLYYQSSVLVEISWIG